MLFKITARMRETNIPNFLLVVKEQNQCAESSANKHQSKFCLTIVLHQRRWHLNDRFLSKQDTTRAFCSHAWYTFISLKL